MKFTILGSGGGMPTPRPFHVSNLSNLAMVKGEPYKRNSSSLYIHDINGIVDCPEDIGDSIYRRKIQNFDNLFVTHWHPDHCFGLRVLIEAMYNFYTSSADKTINIYMPQIVYADIQKVYPNIDYFVNVQKTAKIIFLNHQESVKIGDITVTVIGYSGPESHTYGYKFSDEKKNIFYAPCDTIELKEDIYGLDLLIHECGIFSYDLVKWEISFPDMIDRIRKYKPSKTILTHIEYTEIERYGREYLDRMIKDYNDINFEFAYDGMTMEI